MKKFFKRSVKGYLTYYLTGAIVVYISGWLQTGRAYWLYYLVRQLVKRALNR
jgi:hypothetical protein